VLHVFEGHAVVEQVGVDGDAEGMRRKARRQRSGLLALRPITVLKEFLDYVVRSSAVQDSS
jgi:hypothetical protein